MRSWEGLRCQVLRLGEGPGRQSLREGASGRSCLARPSALPALQQGRADKAYRASIDESMHELECIIKRKDYELKLQEYEQWKIDQAEIMIRDIYKRMQKLGMIDATLPFPKPMRPDLYDRKTSPLPPQKPLIQSYSKYLKASHQYADLFTNTAAVVIKPLYAVGTLLSAAVLISGSYEEIQSPGSFSKHIHVLSILFKGGQPEGRDKGEEPSET